MSPQLLGKIKIIGRQYLLSFYIWRLKKSQISKQRESSIVRLECYSQKIRKIIMSNFLMREVNNLNGIGTLLDFRWSLSATGLWAFPKDKMFPWYSSFLLIYHRQKIFLESWYEWVETIAESSFLINRPSLFAAAQILVVKSAGYFSFNWVAEGQSGWIRRWGSGWGMGGEEWQS